MQPTNHITQTCAESGMVGQLPSAVRCSYICKGTAPSSCPPSLCLSEMTYSIHPATHADVAQIAALTAAAFSQNGIAEYFAAVQPGMLTAEGISRRQTHCQELLDKAFDPSLFLKIVKDDSSEPLACALSEYHEQAPTSIAIGLEDTLFQTQEEREYAEYLKQQRNELCLRAFAQASGRVSRMLWIA